MVRKSTSNRIAELEDELKQRNARIRELRADFDKAEALVSKLREQVEDADTLIGSWIEGFEMTLNDGGKWEWGPFIDHHNELVDKHNALVRDWNRFVPDYNAAVRRRNVGRPLAASEAQIETVLKLHKAGTSLRDIAKDTSLGLRTVRTIIDKRDGIDRTTVKYLERIAPDRAAAARWRARKRTRDGLPKRINETLAKGRELVKEAKGLK
jgi:hypothetical protein